MATSGSWDFSLTAAQIIQAAWEDLGVVEPGVAASTAQIAMALQRLNMLVKQFQGNADMAPGLKIWTRQRVSLFLTNAQVRYLVGPAATDDRASANAIATVLGANKAANATAITVSSTTGMTAADQIGFVLVDGTIGWSTISVVGGATSLTIAANSIGAAASGAVVYTYTSKAQRFVNIEYAALRDNSQVGQPIDLPIRIYTDVQEYERLPQKFAAGDPLAILIEPQRINTAVTCNFAPPNLYKNLRLTVIYPAEDYDSATGSDDISFPQEWYAALSWELAFRLSPAAGIWTPEMQKNHDSALVMARELNPINTSSYYMPNADQ